MIVYLKDRDDVVEATFHIYDERTRTYGPDVLEDLYGDFVEMNTAQYIKICKKWDDVRVARNMALFDKYNGRGFLVWRFQFDKLGV